MTGIIEKVYKGGVKAEETMYPEAIKMIQGLPDRTELTDKEVLGFGRKEGLSREQLIGCVAILMRKGEVYLTRDHRMVKVEEI
ncbi:MAG: hypothetical protein ABIB71_04015 [Candidatus Woesearchaeota archaeon]